MRRTVLGVIVSAAVTMAVAAGCSGAEDAVSSAKDAAGAAQSAAQGASDAAQGAADAAKNAAGQASDAVGAAGGAIDASIQQLQGKVADLVKAQPVTFGPESAELSGSDQKTLQQIGTLLKGSNAKITVETHAGYDDARKAQELSEQRAEAISTALQEAGVSADQVKTNPTGNTTAKGDEALKTTFNITS
ncbi:hypothetical protein PA7_17530 [Pseudonocardia asaccharolytica DSM 44247 = NBRC 16224]|uniref:OmpA-like domain-containing protein n=2 Tax=Pseudonocardia asaccharolytica TaxID=54010 RepID=A0A511CZF1_9PSEU|nr:hypothetical protein PA7_17530 [Pseudonocardia asaccharolytica DSM 44247 = NBRC 16224]